MRNTTRTFAIIGLAALLSGCSLPLQIAALFADGVSLMTTEKTISDHGISAVANKDCAVWRGLSGDEICRDPVDNETAIAKNKVESPAESKAALDAPVTSEPLQVAAVSMEKTGGNNTAFPPPRYRTPRNRAPRNRAPPYGAAGKIKTAPAHPAVANKGFHLVLASFKNPANANRFAQKNPGLKTRLAKAWVKGRPMYRVVVGPLAPEDRAAMRAHLASIGFKNAWPVRLDGPGAASQLAEAR